MTAIVNQRTNDPVNAPLTSGPGISTISKFDLALKIGQGHPRVIIYINFVDLYPDLNFQVSRLWDFWFQRRFLKVLAIHGHGRHLGTCNVTKTVFMNICIPFPKRINIKFGFDWPNSFREKDILKQWSYTCI